MSKITIEIQGEGAEEAAQAFEEIEGLSVERQPPIDDQNNQKKDGGASVLLTALLIAETSLKIANIIYEYYKKHEQNNDGDKDNRDKENKIEKVMLISHKGRRIILRDASIEDIRQILEE